MTPTEPRSDLDLLADDAYHRMVTATTDESRRLWGGRFTTYCNERNAARTPEQIAELEREKGLR